MYHIVKIITGTAISNICNFGTANQLLSGFPISMPVYMNVMVIVD
jgi:hypothetical protein